MDKFVLSVLLIVVFSAVGVAGDFFLKLAGSGPKFIDLKWFALGLVVYASTAFGWFYVMKNMKLATLGVFYSISIILLLTGLGVFYFKEALSAYEMAGILMAIASLLLLARFA